MKQTEKEISVVVFGIAKIIFASGVKSAFRRGEHLSEHDRKHLSHYAIESAREFVGIAIERGLIDQIQLPIEFRK